MLKKAATTTAIAAAGILAMVFAAPAFAQGLATVEPTLDGCRAFVGENGVPETRPVWENRGYSGWDVCLSMAYDGDMDGSFAAADADGDGKLNSPEQASYMDSVIGPVSDPDQSPLTLDKCAAMVSEHGVPAERPFVDWSNRGYGEAEVCQSLAFDGALDASFAAADANADGRLDRAEQGAYIASLSGSPSGVASETEDGGSVSHARDESIVRGQYETSAAGEQYESAGSESAGSAETPSAPEEATAPEPTISAAGVPDEPAATEQPTEAAGTVETAESAQAGDPETGVLSAVNDAVRQLLPDTGGIPILGVLGGAVLIIGGFFAYRFLR